MPLHPVTSPLPLKAAVKVTGVPVVEDVLPVVPVVANGATAPRAARVAGAKVSAAGDATRRRVGSS